MSKFRSRDSVVGIVTGYGLDDQEVGVPSPGGGKNFHFSMFRPALGPTQPPIQWVPEIISSGVKLPGREAHHLPPTSVEKSTPPYVFMA
jgi:hypothetical protein